MKTPREILIQRHQDVVPKLDAIRHQVVESTRRSSILGWPILLWRELVWPCRRIWSGLTAVWILILVTNVSMQDHSQLATAKSLPAPEIIMTWRQQERLLAELVGPDEMRAAPPPKAFLPRPSSERRLEILMT